MHDLVNLIIGAQHVSPDTFISVTDILQSASEVKWDDKENCEIPTMFGLGVVRVFFIVGWHPFGESVNKNNYVKNASWIIQFHEDLH